MKINERFLPYTKIKKVSLIHYYLHWRIFEHFMKALIKSYNWLIDKALSAK